jgi:CheY-like chemotaxis protein
MERTGRVVLIDDNEMDNFFHDWVIKQAGFLGEIVVYQSGEMAVEQIKQIDLSVPTVIFLDINMPGMDGFDVAEAIAPLIAGRPNISVTMLTSSEAEEDRRRADAIPVIKGFITKPLTEEIFRALLKSIDWATSPASIRPEV